MIDRPLDPLVPRPIDRPTPVPLEPDADLSVLDDAKVLAAPDHAGDIPAWRDALARWRLEARERTGYDGSAYDRPGQRWAADACAVAVVWLWDELLHDHATGDFDVERLLEGYAEVGGLDAVVLWHAYPVIGLDDRNQFDWYRQVPDLAGLVARLHERGVRVFLDYNPWDTGTRRAAGSDADELAALVTETGADGVFLDTLKQGDPVLLERLARLDPPPVLEGESRLPLARVPDHALSWAQWFADSEVPGVLRARWFEQRHMMHHTRRWNRDHGVELQSAWLNGAGMLVWDVVFGAWVGWNPRDAASLRLLRRSRSVLGALVDHGSWTPLPPLRPEAVDLHAAGFSSGGTTFWPLVNRGAERYDGPVLAADPPGCWYDLVTGRRADDGTAVRAVVPAHGLGGLLHVADGAVEPEGLHPMLAAAAADPGSDDIRFPARLPQRVVPASAHGTPSPGAVTVPAGRHALRHVFRRRETGMYAEAPYVEEWKPLPPRLHDRQEQVREVVLTSVAVDATEVSNADFARFVTTSGYVPAVPQRFLAHWVGGAPRPGTEHQPVTHVDLTDARAYAAWRGARLPTEDEWQVAVAAGARRLDPLVWSWTESEHIDGRTRFVMLKGGCDYEATGSDWYLDGGPQPPEVSVKLLLPGCGLSRSPTVGFRCAVDVLSTEQPQP